MNDLEKLQLIEILDIDFRSQERGDFHAFLLKLLNSLIQKNNLKKLVIDLG